MCYLQMGMNVNLQNEYGQTPLYVACWRGSVVIVQCLLEFGANPWVVANGGGSCQSVARRFGRMDVLRTLERYCINDEPRFGLSCSGNNWMKSQQDNTNTSPAVTILIDPTKDHPGAGACIVDNALSEQDLQQLERLSGLLPVASCESADDLTATAMDDKMQYRPTRSYFCDSEQIIQGMLQKGIDAARNALSSQSKTNETGSNVSSTENLAFNTSRTARHSKEGSSTIMNFVSNLMRTS
jgi:hypothetical protein